MGLTVDCFAVIFWPAPKQSYTVQPGKPTSRSRAWMPQRKSAARFGQGRPAGWRGDLQHLLVGPKRRVKAALGALDLAKVMPASHRQLPLAGPRTETDPWDRSRRR